MIFICMSGVGYVDIHQSDNIHIYVTPNLGLRVAASVREREQSRFRGSKVRKRLTDYLANY